MPPVNLALLGLLGLVQAVFLPGYLLLRILRTGGGAIATAVFSFALSLLVNCQLVAALVVFRWYRPVTMYAVLAAELALWLLLDYRRLKVPLRDAWVAGRERTRAFFRDVERSVPIGSRWPRRAMFAAATLVIAGFALAGLAETGQIFQQWDAVLSWNRWAVDWATNQLPKSTSYYPQLLPANISLSYVFMQTSQVWIFAKSVQFLFCLMLLLAMLDAARQAGTVPVFAGNGSSDGKSSTKTGLSPSSGFGFVPGVAITYWLFVALLRYRMLSSGYADVPLAFFAWMPVYALVLAGSSPLPPEACRPEQAGAVPARLGFVARFCRNCAGLFRPTSSWKSGAAQRSKWLLLGGLCAAGAALTKQMGLYVAAVYPLLAWLWLGQQPFRALVRMVFQHCLIITVLVAPWYIYKFADIQSGRDVNNTPQLVLECHAGRNLPQRLLHAGAEVAEATTLPGGGLLLAAVAASLGDRRARRLFCLFVLPLGLLWAAAFSYDLRNLAMLVPFVGMAAGIGLVRIVCWAEGMVNVGWDKRALANAGPPNPLSGPSCDRRGASASIPLYRVCVGHVVALAILLSVAAAFCIRDDALLASQRLQQRSVGIASLNRRLYSYAASHSGVDLPPGIATDYLALRWLPELAPRSVACATLNLSAFRQTFDRADVGYVLLRNVDAASEVRAFLARPRTARLLFEDHGYAFYEKCASAGDAVASAH